MQVNKNVSCKQVISCPLQVGGPSYGVI